MTVKKILSVVEIIALGAVLILCLQGSVCAAPPAADFYVATDGNDTWTGSLDAPFATVQKAQQAIRALKQIQPDRSTPITIMVRGGTYFINSPLVFIPEDSGSSSSPIVYAAYPGEKPVFSGGRIIDGWKQDSKGRWQALILDVKRGKWNFQQLFVNGERRYRPRLPKDGYYKIADSVPGTKPGLPDDRFKFNPGEIRADWSNRGDVELLCFQYWTMARLRVADVDETQDIVTTTGPVVRKVYYADLAKGGRYIVENVKEAMGDPGEWYLDRKSGTLTYFPMPGEDMNNIEVVAPVAERLVEIKGDIKNRRWVERITFRGLSFMHTNWTTPPEGYNFWQSEAILGAAVSAEGARNCTFDGCSVSHTGIYGIDLGAGCMYNRVLNCELTDLGAGGVKIGAQDIGSDEEAVASFNIVDNSLIAHGGRLHPAGVGVWIGQSHHNTIIHNDIFDFYYSGVSAGWSWGYGPSLAHHNIIEYNHIYKIGQGVLSDMGGIYALGISPGTVEKNNVIHDVRDSLYGGNGIYLDEGSSQMLIENNLIYRTISNPFVLHYGRSNRVLNNIFIVGDQSRVGFMFGRDNRFEHNIVYGTEKGINMQGPEVARFADNIYYPGSGVLEFGGQYRLGTQDFQVAFQPSVTGPNRITMFRNQQAAVPAAGTRNFGTVPTINKPDGEFPGSSAWKKALVLPEMVGAREEKAPFPTDIRILKDENYLYIRMECRKNPPGADLDETDMWRRSRVEIFLRPNMKDERTFQFGLARDGRMEARIYPTLKELTESRHTVIDFDWTGRATEIEGGWCAEAKFPIENLTAMCGGSTDSWGIFLGRVDQRGRSLDFRTKSGEEPGSIIADPLFVNQAEDDFRLRPVSPALKAGFKPFDISGAGRQGVQKTAHTEVPRAYPPASPK